MSLGVRLGSFPVPGEAGLLYLGLTKPNRSTYARPSMQDTPPRTSKRIRSKTTSGDQASASSASMNGPNGSGAASSSGCTKGPSGNGAAASSGSGAAAARASGRGHDQQTFVAAFAPYVHAREVTYWTPSDLNKQFVKSCDKTRARGVEQMAFVLGEIDPEKSEPTHLHIEITYLLFPRQAVRAQTVEVDLASTLQVLDKERQNRIDCGIWTVFTGYLAQSGQR